MPGPAPREVCQERADIADTADTREHLEKCPRDTEFRHRTPGGFCHGRVQHKQALHRIRCFMFECSRRLSKTSTTSQQPSPHHSACAQPPPVIVANDAPGMSQHACLASGGLPSACYKAHLETLLEVAAHGGVKLLHMRGRGAAVPLNIRRTNVDVNASVVCLTVRWSLFDEHSEAHCVHDALLPLSRLPCKRTPHGVADHNAFRVPQGRRRQIFVPGVKVALARRTCRLHAQEDAQRTYQNCCG